MQFAPRLIKPHSSQDLGKVYRDSDYTVVMAIMQLDKRIIIVLKLTLVVEIQALLSLVASTVIQRAHRF